MQITFDTANPSDLAILTRLLQNLEAPQLEAVAAPAPAPEAAAAVEPEKPKRGRKPKAETAPEEPATEPAPEVDPRQMKLPGVAVEAMDETAAPQKTYTLDEVRGALQQFTAAKGVPAGIELLKEFSASRISELSAERYADFVARCAA